VIAELKAKFKDAATGNICVTSREMIGFISPDKTIPGLLTDESLLRLALGSDKMLRDAKTTGCKRATFSVLENNLELCVREAFPGCKVVEHQKQEREMGKKFTGFGFAIERE